MMIRLAMLKEIVVSIVLAACASASTVSNAAAAPTNPITPIEQTVSEFAELWSNMSPGNPAPGRDTRVMCTWGWSARHEMFLGGFLKQSEDFFDEKGDPRLVLLVMSSRVRPESVERLTRFIEEFGPHRVFVPGEDAGGNTCDFIFIDGQSGSAFSVSKMLPILPEPPQEFVFVMTLPNCLKAKSDCVYAGVRCEVDERHGSLHTTPECNAMIVQYSDSNLAWVGGSCHGDVCISKMTKEFLVDPLEPMWDCARYSGDVFNSSLAETAEFGQDYFIYRNFFRDYQPKGRNGKGVYIDIGAHMPFEYSNTAFFDKCLGWDGLCVEPNPDLAPFFDAYRSCKFFQNCIFEEPEDDHLFVTSMADTHQQGFYADCVTLDQLLHSQNLARPEVIDFLSIDVESSDLSMVVAFNFHEFDIRVILFEVQAGTRWMEIDMILLQNNFVKVAVIGRDCVYVSLEFMREMGAQHLPVEYEWPHNWENFTVQVLLDEQQAVRAGQYPELLK